MLFSPWQPWMLIVIIVDMLLCEVRRDARHRSTGRPSRTFPITGWFRIGRFWFVTLKIHFAPTCQMGCHYFERAVIKNSCNFALDTFHVVFISLLYVNFLFQCDWTLLQRDEMVSQLTWRIKIFCKLALKIWTFIIGRL